MSINGNPATPLVLGFYPQQSPVLPGDSLSCYSVNNYTFDEDPFVQAASGPVHDIIVWPLYVGAPQIDSVDKEVYFVNTALPASTELGTSSANFPEVIFSGKPEDLTITIHNHDLEHVFYEPFQFLMSIDGDAPKPLGGINLLPEIPLSPGESFTYSIPAYQFDPQRFSGGGGVTHDIIVWPLRNSNLPTNIDSLEVMSVAFVDGAAFEVQSENLNGLPSVVDVADTYNLQINAFNIGISSNANSIEFLVQLDDENPVVLNSVSNMVIPGDLVSSGSIPLNLSNLYSINPSDSAFVQSSHEVKFWAREVNGVIWYISADFPVISSLGTNSPALPTTNLPALPGEEDAGANNGNNFSPRTSGNNHPNIFPNPVLESMTIDFSKVAASEAWISLYSLDFQPAGVFYWKKEDSLSRARLSLQGLKPGIYLYKVSTLEGQVFSGKFVKR